MCLVIIWKSRKNSAHRFDSIHRKDSEAVSRQRYRKIDILFAVRNTDTAMRLRDFLEDPERCSVRIVSDGISVMEEAERIVPDILVIDAILPYGDGLGVVDRLRELLGERMPCVIGGAAMPFAEKGFVRRRAAYVLGVPWNEEELRAAVLLAMEEILTTIDWNRLQKGFDQACTLLSAAGMRSELKGCTFLAWSAALACENDGRLRAISSRIYAPVAQQFHTTPQNVERLIRHAVETTMDSPGSGKMYAFFGNTIDPARGKPTNAQMIALLAQRMRVA